MHLWKISHKDPYKEFYVNLIKYLTTITFNYSCQQRSIVEIEIPVLVIVNNMFYKFIYKSLRAFNHLMYIIDLFGK